MELTQGPPGVNHAVQISSENAKMSCYVLGVVNREYLCLTSTFL